VPSLDTMPLGGMKGIDNSINDGHELGSMSPAPIVSLSVFQIRGNIDVKIRTNRHTMVLGKGRDLEGNHSPDVGSITVTRRLGRSEASLVLTLAGDDLGCEKHLCVVEISRSEIDSGHRRHRSSLAFLKPEYQMLEGK